MKNLAEAPPILAAQIPRKCLRKRVAKRIRMAKTLAFDDFDEVIAWSVNCYYGGNQLNSPEAWHFTRYDAAIVSATSV